MSAWSVSNTLTFEHNKCSRTNSSRWCDWRQCMHVPDRQECWLGMGRSRLRHLLSAGLCPVKPCCSFPQLRPRLNCHGQDQSPEGHLLHGRGQQPPHHTVYTKRMCFFSFTPSKMWREMLQLCTTASFKAVFFLCLERCSFLISCEPNTLTCIRMPCSH